MRMQARERILRLFVGALLSSQLSEKELEDMVSEICTDPSFLLDLRLALRQSLRSFGEQRALFESVSESRDAGSIEDRIVEAIQRRRMSKAAVRDLMLATNPNFKHIRIPNKMPLKVMIKEFISVASANEMQDLLRSIETAGGEDPYLKGIVTRR